MFSNFENKHHHLHQQGHDIHQQGYDIHQKGHYLKAKVRAHELLQESTLFTLKEKKMFVSSVKEVLHILEHCNIYQKG